MITLDSIPPKPFSFVHFNMIQPVLTWTVCDPDETRSNEIILSRHGHTRLQKNETESHSAQIWRGFETISGRTSRKVAITGLTFKPWSSQSNYQPKNNWHKFVRSYLDYFLSKINDFIPGKLKKSKFWESLLIYM